MKLIPTLLLCLILEFVFIAGCVTNRKTVNSNVIQPPPLPIVKHLEFESSLGIPYTVEYSVDCINWFPLTNGIGLGDSVTNRMEIICDAPFKVYRVYLTYN